MITFAFTNATVRRLLVTLGVALGVVAVVSLGPHGREAPPSPSLPTLTPPAEQPLRSVATAKPVVALTFDISWGTVMPPKVLAILTREHVAATFFLSGPWVSHNTSLVRQMVRDGFQIESHGQAHVNYSGLSPAGLVANMEAANQAIKSVTGFSVRYVRPPNGDYNRRALSVAQSLGYRIVIWDTDSLDWMNPGVGRIIQRVVTRAHPGDIILMHASDTCKQTDLALPTIIQDLRAKELQFVTLNTLLKDGTSANGATGY